MTTNKILLKFAKKGINLSPEAYAKVINAENPLDFASSLIVKLKSDKLNSKDLVSVDGETIDKLTGTKQNKDTTNQKILNDKKPTTEKTYENKPKKDTSSQETKKPTTERSDENKLKKDTPSQETKKPLTIDNLKKDSDKKEKYVNKTIEEASEKIQNKNIKFKRNQQKINVEYDFEIIQDISNKSYTSGELENLISYFKSLISMTHRIA